MLDDHGIRPPLMAAGINLFGGALGLLHQHVTGAIPIRRNSKDPVYLVDAARPTSPRSSSGTTCSTTRRADAAISGELKSPKTGLLQAALGSDRATLCVVPMAVSYDIVLEEQMLVAPGDVARASGRSRRKSPRWCAMRSAIRSRAFVTFGRPIPLSGYDPDSRRDLVALAHRIQHDIGRLYKVLPTALVAVGDAAADRRAASWPRASTTCSPTSRPRARTSRCTAAGEAVDDGVERLVERGILVAERQRLRVRDRLTLRYYARTIEHLLTPARKAAH